MLSYHDRHILRYAVVKPLAYELEIGYEDGWSDAGFDMRSPVSVNVAPGECVSIDTGIVIELPRDTKRWKWEAVIRPRSSMRRQNIIASIGTIDAGYRGEIGCILHNHSDVPYSVVRGDKICQLVVQKLPRVQWQRASVSELEMDTARGDKRYGSTGK